jgi:hypothetical protein
MGVGDGLKDSASHHNQSEERCSSQEDLDLDGGLQDRSIRNKVVVTGLNVED